MKIWSKRKKAVALAIYLVPAIFYLASTGISRSNAIDKFRSSNVSGRIESLREASKGTMKMGIGGEIYLVASNANGARMFKREASVGDSIHKPAYADKLILYSGGEEYFIELSEFHLPKVK
ncbi:MAG: hypothetical protein COA58_04740 [Bacteroidetes bacterium]|nr:MAG: hypothetical protein COA58_04740 [Bacteroidota bacterium]